MYTTVEAKAGPYITDYNFPRQTTFNPSLQTRDEGAARAPT